MGSYGFTLQQFDKTVYWYVVTISFVGSTCVYDMQTSAQVLMHYTVELVAMK